MQAISRDINVPLNVLDVDVAAAATARCNVFAAAEGTDAYTVELRVTLLGASPVNLAMRVLGQLSTPAADPTTLLQVSVATPDMSALAANFARIFVLPAFTPFQQLEFQNVSGGNVHVQVFVQGCDAEFVDAPSSSSASHVVVDTLPALVASLAAIGKLAANAGVNIGTIDVAAYSPFTLAQVQATDNNAHAISTSQAVKTPVFVKAEQTMVGTVIISDGTHTGVTLAKGDSAPFYCTNINQLTYQFSNSGATERFSVSAGI